MTLFRTSTIEAGDYLLQRWYDSKDNSFYVVSYTLEGLKHKVFEKSNTEKGAMEIAMRELNIRLKGWDK